MLAVVHQEKQKSDDLCELIVDVVKDYADFGVSLNREMLLPARKILFQKIVAFNSDSSSTQKATNRHFYQEKVDFHILKVDLRIPKVDFHI